MFIRWWKHPIQARLVLKEADFVRLRQHLLQPNGLERTAFAMLGCRQSPDHLELYVHRLILPGDNGYLRQHAAVVEPCPEYVLQTFATFTRSGVPGYLHAHSHPFSSNADFSSVDDRYFPGMWQSLSNFLKIAAPERTNDFLFARLVCGRAETGFRAQCLMADGRLLEIEELHIVGPSGIRTILKAKLQPPDERREIMLLSSLLDRNVRFLGEAGQRKILSTHVVICGAGGLGSFIMLQAKGLGFRKITIIDPDLVEETNLNRLAGATRQDIGRPKVFVLADDVWRYDPCIRVQPIHAPVQSRKAQKAIVAGDVVVNCLDNDTARLEVQILAARHLRPLLDLGSGILLDKNRKTVTEMGGQAVFYIPGGPCLVCQGLDPTRIVSEEIRAVQGAAGYIAGTDETPPAVVTLNAIIAGLGMDLLVKYLTGFAPIPTYLRYDLLRHQVLSGRFDKRPDCPICGQDGFEGKGEETICPLPCSHWTAGAIPTPNRGSIPNTEAELPRQGENVASKLVSRGIRPLGYVRAQGMRIARMFRPRRRPQSKEMKKEVRIWPQR